MLRVMKLLTKLNGTVKMELIAYGGAGTYGTAWKVKWYNRAPENSLGVIIYLTEIGQLSHLNISLLSLRRYLFKPRPIVIFHEGDFDDVNIQLALASILGSNMPLGFEHIRFPTK
ncbi:unnamed protein product, partial [Rotaria sp. Silwood2]